MATTEHVDPAIAAYLGAAMTLLKLWHADSQRAAAAVTDDVDDARHPSVAPHIQRLQSIHRAAAALHVPEPCQPFQRAFLAAMARGINDYIALTAPEAREHQRVAMLSGMENFAILDAELARMEQQFGPFETE